MAVPAAVLSILVQANTGGATRGLLRFNQQLDGTEAKSNKATRALGTFAKVGVAGSAIGLGYAVKKAADFEQQLDSLGSVSDASGKQMERFRKQAMKAGADTKFSALDAAVAQTELAKGGLKVRQIMRGGLAAALSLAAAGEMELGEAAATTANALNLFGLEGKSSMKVADALAKAANATTADVTDFAMALRQSGGVAKTAGLSFSETVLALEALANAGTKNSDAGTSLKTALIQLIKPTEKQQALANKLNLSFLDAEGNFKNLADVSTMLRDRLGGMTAAQRTATLATLAGTDGVRTLTALYDAGPSKLEKWKKGLNESGTAAEVAARKQSNLKGRLENLQGSVETIAIAVGMKLIPSLTKYAEKLTDILNDTKLSGSEKVGKVAELLAEAIGKGIAAAGAVAAKAAPHVAWAFVKAFMEADAWGKLAIGGAGAFLLKKLGLGSGIGRLLGRGGGLGGGGDGILKSAKPVPVFVTNPGGIGGGKGGPVGGVLKGAAATTALQAAARAVPLLAAGSVIAYIASKNNRNLPTGSGSGTGTRAKPVEDAARGRPGLTAPRDAFKREIGTQIAPSKGMKDESLAAAAIGTIGLAKRVRAARKEINAMRAGSGADIDALATKAKKQFKNIEDSIGLHTRKGRQVASQNFEAAATNIGRSIAKGRTSSSKGMSAIENLMRTHSKVGKERLTQNLIQAANNIKRSMKEGEIATGKGTRAIEALMVKALQNMGFTKEQALDARRAKKEGSTNAPGAPGSGRRPNQRGGPIMEGALSGDSVPSILERGEYVLNRKAVRAVGKSKLDQINFKQAPRFAKGGSVGIQNMVAAANQFERAGFPYDYGGGHQATPAPFGPVDCSGAVSYVLQHGGVKIPTMVSGAMTGIGKPGKGAVTVYANPGHVWMSIMGRAFGTSTSNPAGGAGWIDPFPDAAYQAGFTVRHFGKNDVGAGFPGMGGAPKLPKVLVDGPDSLLKATVQGAISNTHAAAQEKLNNIAAQAATPIGTGDAGTHTGSWKGGSTKAFAQRLASKVGLSLGSGYRTPAYNASVGGAPNSMHTHGTAANPGAWDVPVLANGPDAAKGDKLAALGRAARLAEVIWKAPDHYDHVHLGFFQKGGLVERLMGMQAGGAVGSRMDEYKRLLVLANRKIGVPPPPMGAGLVDVETGWDPAAVSSAGAFGITQFMPGTAPSYGVQRGTSHGAVASQILGMAKYLKELGYRGDPRGALAKYNGGPGNPQYGYAADVMAASKKYPPSTFAGLVGGGGSGDGGGGGGKGTSGEGGPIKKLAYVGDSLGVGTLGAGLKAKLGKIKLASSVSGGKTSSWGVGALKGLLGKDVGAAMLDMGTNDGTAGNLRPSIDAVEGMLKGRPLLMASLDPQSTDVAKKNAAIRANANVVVPWAGVAQKFASDKVHPTGAGYSKRASLIASAVKRLRTGGKDESGLTDREKKQLKTPLKGSLGKVLTKTLKVLRSNKPAKFRGTRLKQLEKRIKGMGVGLPDGMRKQIATLRAGVEETGEYADRASSLSVDNEDGTTSLGVIKGKTEAGWVTDQLDMLFKLRERLVDAKKILEKHRAEIQKAIERMQKRLQAIVEQVRENNENIKRARKSLKEQQKHPKRNAATIKGGKAHIEVLEGRNKDLNREREAIGDKILPALTGKRKQFTTFINEHIMGSDGLPAVQGLGSPLEKLTALPPIGVLGGSIFDAQIRLRELAAPATSITDDATSETSESADLLRQLLQEANLRTAVSQKQYEVLRNMPPYGGQFATGGVVPGPIGAARTIVAHGGETVTPPGNGSAPVVQLNFASGMEWLDKYIEVKVDGVTRKQARAGARGLPGRGGGI